LNKYESRGVSANKSEVHDAIKHLDKGLYPTAFCKILPDLLGGNKRYANIMHADTAGTKTSLAYMYWRETGDMSVWAGIAQDAIVMNLDDMACVGCTDQIVLSSTIGRNKKHITGEVIAALIHGTTSFIDKMAAEGVHIHLAGGETADVGDIVRTVDVGFTAFARVPRKALIINKIRAGDVIVGFASFGQSTYETDYNSGMGSNGLTSARHDMFAHTYATKYPECFEPTLPNNVVFSGKHLLTDQVEVPGVGKMHAGKLVLSPTRTYLPLIKAIKDAHQKDVHGMIHCTGGGQTKVMKYVNHVHIIKDNMFDVPPLFNMIQAASDTAWREMYTVFNMGHRLECYVPAHIAQDLIDLGAKFGIAAQIIGHVEKSKEAKLTLKTPFGTFTDAHH
jgi:phosphoribosylformylglycinamidine cyclo-ligase